jgi:hypothetical protein
MFSVLCNLALYVFENSNIILILISDIMNSYLTMITGILNNILIIKNNNHRKTKWKILVRVYFIFLCFSGEIKTSVTISSEY